MSEISRGVSGCVTEVEAAASGAVAAASKAVRRTTSRTTFANAAEEAEATNALFAPPPRFGAPPSLPSSPPASPAPPPAVAASNRLSGRRLSRRPSSYARARRQVCHCLLAIVLLPAMWTACAFVRAMLIHNNFPHRTSKPTRNNTFNAEDAIAVATPLRVQVWRCIVPLGNVMFAVRDACTEHFYATAEEYREAGCGEPEPGYFADQFPTCGPQGSYSYDQHGSHANSNSSSHSYDA